MTSANLLVVKLGGGAGLDLEAACDDLARIAAERLLVVAHGVSATMDQLCADLGLEVRTLTSPSGHISRYTPPALRDVYVQAAGMANADITAGLQRRGATARAFLGEDIALSARRKTAIRAIMNGRTRMIRDDHSGAIRGVKTEALVRALREGAVPVLPPLATSGDGALNIDGDRAGAAVAGALGADTLVILSNVRGLYRDFPREDSFVSEVPLARIDDALDWAQGRMKRKVIAAKEALEMGVETVIIADGRAENPLSRALDGDGTRFRL